MPRAHHIRNVGAKQLDDGIGDTVASVDATSVRWGSAMVTRFASRAEAAIVTARQYRLVGRGGLSLNSDSSSQSSAESLACSGPNNSVTALMKADNSRSAISICSAQVELLTDGCVFMELSPLQVYCAATIAADATSASHQKVGSDTIGRWYCWYFGISQRQEWDSQPGGEVADAAKRPVIFWRGAPPSAPHPGLTTYEEYNDFCLPQKMKSLYGSMTENWSDPFVRLQIRHVLSSAVRPRYLPGVETGEPLRSRLSSWFANS